MRLAVALLAALLLTGCSLTPAPEVPRLHASGWCSTEEVIGCDAGIAGSLAAWRWNEQATYLGLAAFLGQSSGGVGAYYSLGGTPAVALGGGVAIPYDSAGLGSSVAPVLGVTVSWGSGAKDLLP